MTSASPRLPGLLGALLGLALSLPGNAAAAAPGAPPAGRPKVCLVLAGGGARGIAHVGVLKVLAELNVPIDCVVGTSMGSIVGAAFASGNSAEQIEAIVRGADWSRLLTDNPDRAQRSVYAKALERSHVGTAEFGVRDHDLQLPRGVLAGQQLQPFLRAFVPPGSDLKFDELPIPYRAVATNFESGKLVVLDHGDLAVAIRASMSVPGAFDPIDFEGQMLVDGGLVRNLPIDVAQVFKPDVVIAVDLGAPMLKREEIGSLFKVGLQTINILMAQNVERSLHDLTGSDILISPDVSDIESSDFTHSLKGIERGEAAARAVADKLTRLSVTPAAYLAWSQLHQHVPRQPKYAHVKVDTSGLTRVNPATVQALFADTDASVKFQEHIDKLLSTDDFERVDAHTEAGPDGDTLVLKPVEKSWGPNYLRLGLTLGADLNGGSDFTIFADSRRTWLNQSGLEWRLRASIGHVTGLTSEWRQPLDITHTWFAAGLVGASLEQRNLYADEFPVAVYRLSQYVGGAEIGRDFGNIGELAAGLNVDDALASFYSGVPLLVLDDQRRTQTGGHLRFSSDTLDNLDFPQRGHQVGLVAELWRPAFGGSLNYDRFTTTASQAYGNGRTSVLATARWQTTAGSQVPLYQAFTLGGFLNMSGLRQDQIIADRILFLRTVLRQKVASSGSLLPGLYVGASLEAADARDRLNPLLPGVSDITAQDLRIGAGSVFLSAESLLGPFYLALGHSRGGQTALYLYIGRP